MTTVDRFPELIRILSSISDDKMSKSVESGLRRSSIRLVRDLARNAPSGEDGFVPRPAGYVDRLAFERPSLRQWGTTFSESFDATPEIEIEGGTVSVSVSIDHPSYNQNEFGMFEWITEGTKRHPIPGQYLGYPLIFWWGEPLRWGPDFFPDEGLIALDRVEHPGAMPNSDWLDQAVEGYIGDVSFAVDKVYDVEVFDTMVEGYILRHG